MVFAYYKTLNNLHLTVTKRAFLFHTKLTIHVVPNCTLCLLNEEKAYFHQIMCRLHDDMTVHNMASYHNFVKPAKNQFSIVKTLNFPKSRIASNQYRFRRVQFDNWHRVVLSTRITPHMPMLGSNGLSSEMLVYQSLHAASSLNPNDHLTDVSSRAYLFDVFWYSFLHSSFRTHMTHMHKLLFVYANNALFIKGWLHKKPYKISDKRGCQVYVYVYRQSEYKALLGRWRWK